MGDGDEIQSAALVEGQVYEVDTFLDAKGYIFPAGHRLRFTVASAAAPFFEANSNTGKLLDKSHVKATNAVHMAARYPSHVILPVVKIADLPPNDHFVAPV